MTKILAAVAIAVMVIGFGGQAMAASQCEIIAITTSGDEFVVGSGANIDEAEEGMVMPDNVQEIFAVCE